MEARFVFGGGGTGGHLYPGIAVARALLTLAPGAQVTFFTTMRPLDGEVLGAAALERVPQPVRPFSKRPWDWPTFWLAWRTSVAQARGFMQRARPQAVLGLGGYAAGPPVVAARQLGIRTAILNPDAVPGRANRFLARRADIVVTQWDRSAQCFRDGTACRTIGCPIRAEFETADATTGRRLFELEAGRPTLLVTGASQGARTLNQVLFRVWPAFRTAHPEWQLLHLTGPADEQAAREAYVAARAPARVVAFTHDMPAALAAADLVVSRAGASTLAELTALGKPAILLPYPYHRDRHQHANAQVLVDEGAAVLIEDRCDAELNRGPLLAALERLAGATARQTMAAAAQRLARPGAAAEIARWLLEGRL